MDRQHATMNRTGAYAFGSRGTAAIVALVAGLAAPAAGQTALGDGRLLDNNLSTTTKFNAPVRDFRAEQRLRDAIVTGNAPGGLSFRGDVGYGAAGDFSQQLGSNDLFEFRRDSLTSGLGGLGIRGTSALQYQTALTTGSRPPSTMSGGFTVPRAGVGFDAGTLRDAFGGAAGEQPTTRAPGENAVGIAGSTLRTTDDALSPFDRENASIPGYGLDVQLRRDRDGSVFGTLRAPSAFLAAQDFTPAYLSPLETTREGEPLSALVASSLRGIRAIDMTGTGAGLAGLEEDLRPGQAASGRTDGGRQDGALINNRLDAIPGSLQGGTGEPGADSTNQTGTAYDQAIGRIRAASESRTDVAGQATGIGPGELDPAIDAMRQLLAERDGRAAEAFEADQVAAGDLTEAYRPLAEAVRSGGDVTQFVDQDTPDRDIYAEHMLSGQRLMAEARYFAAEERFTLALTIRPGDVTARVGRVHAQIGAGMFMSASVNLTSLLREHPEISGTRYAPRLLPRESRTESVISLFGEYIGGNAPSTARVSPELRKNSGLLLAYLGFQTRRVDLVASGLDSFERFATESADRRGIAEVNDADLRLAAFLRKVWLEAEDAPGAPEVDADPIETSPAEETPPAPVNDGP